MQFLTEDDVDAFYLTVENSGATITYGNAKTKARNY